MEDQSKRIAKAAHSFVTLRNLQDLKREHPEREELDGYVRMHMKRLQALSAGFCSGGAELKAPAPAAMPATIAW